MLKHVRWQELETDHPHPKIDMQYVVSGNAMLARVVLHKGAVVPEHSHVSEQMSYVLNGALKFWVNGQEFVVNSGEVICIPSNMPHRAEALEDTLNIDVFDPPREDWINRRDATSVGMSRENQPASKL